MCSCRNKKNVKPANTSANKKNTPANKTDVQKQSNADIRKKLLAKLQNKNKK